MRILGASARLIEDFRVKREKPNEWTVPVRNTRNFSAEKYPCLRTITLGDDSTKYPRFAITRKRAYNSLIMEPNVTNPNNNSLWASVKEWIQVIVIALIISLPIRFFIAEPFIVNGASMDPTFSTGQFLIVDRLSYRLENPQRGDVIVFKYPNNPSIYYIKRIIGLPGETLSMKDGSVTVTNPADTTFTTANPNGLVLDESYIDPTHKSHDDITTVLGPDKYFVMGDNSASSRDSRFWGFVPRKNLLGKAIFIYWPLHRMKVLN